MSSPYQRDSDSAEIWRTVGEILPATSRGQSAPANALPLELMQERLGQMQMELQRLAGRLETMATADDGYGRRGKSNGGDLIASAGAAAWPAFFDLVDLATDSFAVLGTALAGSGAAWICGVKKSIGASGMTWDGTDRWTSGTISASQYVYLDLSRSGASATIVMATTLPDGSHTGRIRPLWSIPWIPPAGEVAGYIDTANIVDMRGAKQIEAMA